MDVPDGHGETGCCAISQSLASFTQNRMHCLAEAPKQGKSTALGAVCASTEAWLFSGLSGFVRPAGFEESSDALR